MGGQVKDAKTFSDKYNSQYQPSIDLKIPSLIDNDNKKFTYSGTDVDTSGSLYKSLDADYNGKSFSAYAGNSFPNRTVNDKSLFYPYAGISKSIGNFDLSTEYYPVEQGGNKYEASVDYNFNKGGKIKYKLKKEEIGAIENEQTQHRAGGGIIEGKPGIDTNHASLRPGSFVIPKKKVPHAIKDGILRPNQATKFQDGGVPVKLTAGEGLLSPEKAARLHAQGVDLNEYAPDTDFPYSPENSNSLMEMAAYQYGGGIYGPGERNATSNDKTVDSGKKGKLFLPQDTLFKMGARTGTGIDIHGRDTTMTFNPHSKDSMTWRIKNKTAVYDPHASLALNEGGKTGLNKGGIHIKKANRGKFTAYKKRTGKTTEEALHSSDPHVRKMANFAKNAKHWKHDDGGEIKGMQDGGQHYAPSTNEPVTSYSPVEYTGLQGRGFAAPENKKEQPVVNTPEKTTTPVAKTEVKKIQYKTKTKATVSKQESTKNKVDTNKESLFNYDWNNMHPEQQLSFINHFPSKDTVEAPIVNVRESDKVMDLLQKNLGRNKGGKIKMQAGGGVPLIDPSYGDYMSSPSLARSKSGEDNRNTDTTFGLNNKNTNPIGLPDYFFLPQKTSLQPVNLLTDTKPLTAKDNTARLSNSILGDQPLYKQTSPDNVAANTNTAKPPISLYDQAIADEKKYRNVTSATDLALLAGNLSSSYVPTSRPRAYTPDVYERNVNAEATQANKELDKEAATARYNARNSGMAYRPDIDANLMDKRLELGARTDEARENERKSVYEQRNQASLLNLNANNTYNTMEANRLADFRREKGQASSQVLGKLQDSYKSSIEDKYALLGSQNQAKIAQENAKNQFYNSFGIQPPSKWDTDYTTWKTGLGHNPSDAEVKEFNDKWKKENPNAS